MAQTPRERRAAQRRLAAIIKRNKELRSEQREHLIDQRIRAAVFQGRVDYANSVLNGQNPMPAKGSAESKNLASLASFASRGRADPRFEAAFSRYWYHNKEINFGPDAVTYEEGNEADYDEDSDEEE
jgi:hypothetical protein